MTAKIIDLSLIKSEKLMNIDSSKLYTYIYKCMQCIITY